ncbi:hypothetical protein Emag_005457 [Eimeria magna]
MASSTRFLKQHGEQHGQPAAENSISPSSTPGHSGETVTERPPSDALLDRRSKDSRRHSRFRIFGGLLLGALLSLLAANITPKLLRSPVPVELELLSEDLCVLALFSTQAQSAVDEIVTWVANSKGPEEEIDWHAILREELLTKPEFPDIRKYVSENGRFTADFVHKDLNAADEVAEKLLSEVEGTVQDFFEGSMPVCQRSVRFGEALGGAGLATITGKESNCNQQQILGSSAFILPLYFQDRRL